MHSAAVVANRVFQIGLLSIGLAFSSLPAGAAGFAVGNVLISPISENLIRLVVASLSGQGATSSNWTDACADGAVFEGHHLVGRVLQDDIAVTGHLRRGTQWLQLGPACEVVVSEKTSAGVLRLDANVQFQDAWDMFDPQETRVRSWMTASGNTVQIPMMNVEHLLSVATYGSETITAIPFRDRRFALFLLTGPSVRADARSYFGSSDFANGKGFRASSVALSLPRLSLQNVSVRCIAHCSSTIVTQRIELTLNEDGAGDARVLPHGISKLGVPGGDLVYTSYSEKYESTTVRANRPFYVGIVDINRHELLIGAFVANPTSH